MVDFVEWLPEVSEITEPNDIADVEDAEMELGDEFKNVRPKKIGAREW